VDINTYLTSLSKELVIDPILKSRIDVSISHLKEKIWGLFQERLLEVAVIGSFDRETFIEQDEEGDVDILVVFKQKEFQPDTYLKQIRAFCEKNYPRSEIYPDHPTMVVEMEHIKFEIVPSFNYSSDTVKIPAPKTKELKWISSSPKHFKSTTTKKDANNKGLILPLIRIIKYWNSINGKLFSSYELEKFIVDKIYNCSNLKDYYFSATGSLDELAKTEQHKKLLMDLKEKHRRIRVMENYKLPEYIAQELATFLPLP
jgi:predicted nucleotidyltransferase